MDDKKPVGKEKGFRLIIPSPRIMKKITSWKGLTTREFSATQSNTALLETRPDTSTHPRTTTASSRLLRTATARTTFRSTDVHTLQSSASAVSSVQIYPEWLTNRKDFQDLKYQYERLDIIDCFSVCAKVANLRNDFERSAVIKLMKTCPFFSNMKDYELSNISERLHSIAFSSGQRLITQGELADCLYLIVSGKVGIYIDSDQPVDEVMERNVIGETALQKRSIRTATVIAHGNVKALKLTYEDYDTVAFKIKLQDFHSVSGFLRSMEHFSDWNVSKLYRLASVIIVNQYPQGRIIYNIGEPAHDLYIIREGSVAIKVSIELEKTNRWPVAHKRWSQVKTKNLYEKTLRSCAEGDFFGEQELVEKTARNAVALCTSPTCVLFIIREEFFSEIFSDKDRKTLYHKFEGRPSSAELRDLIRTEKRKARTTTEAMLNALDTNCLPRGREMYLGPSRAKKITWARFLVSKGKAQIRKNLVTQEKDETELSGWSLEDVNAKDL